MSQASSAAQYHDQTLSEFDQSTYFLQFKKFSTSSAYFTSYDDTMINQYAQKCTKYIYTELWSFFQVHGEKSIMVSTKKTLMIRNVS